MSDRTYRFISDTDPNQIRRQSTYINERAWPAMQVIYANSVDMPNKIREDQILITKDDGCIYIWWNNRYKKLNFEKGRFNGGGSDSASTDNIVVVYDDTELAGKELHENALYIIRRTGTIRYYDGQQLQTLFSNEEAHKVNGHTVESDVPKDAKFTDTTYDVVDEDTNGLMNPDMLAKLNATVSEDELKTTLDNYETRDDFKTGIESKADKDEVYTKNEVDALRQEASKKNRWKTPVTTQAELPHEAEPGDIALVTEEDNLYVFREKDGWKNLLKKVQLPGNATEETSGFMSAEDKKFLDEIPEKYVRTDSLEEVKRAIPNIDGYAKTVEVTDLINASVAPLAKQKSVDELEANIKNVRESIPNAYSMSESDARYLKVADKQDMSGYALKTDIDVLPHKEDLLDFASKDDLNKYVRIEMLDSNNKKFMQRGDADMLYAPKAPAGSSYALSSSLANYALVEDVIKLQNIITSLQKQVDELMNRKKTKDIVIGLAVMDNNGMPSNSFICVTEYSKDENFIYVPRFAEEASFYDGMCVRLFSNLQDVAMDNGAVLHSETKMDAYTMLHTNVAGPYYYLTQPIHITKDYQLKVKNMSKTEEQGEDANG